MNSCRYAVFLLMWGTLIGPAAWAQSTGNATDPGRLQERIERPKEFPKKVAPVTVPGVPAAPDVEEVRKFRLIGAEIVGSTIYDSARLGDFYEPYLNREISPADIDAIIKAITEQYRKDGYFLTRVIAPPQSVEFGVLRLRIIEGYVAEVVYKGAKPGRAYLFDAWAGRITAERPLKLGTLERNLLLMAGVPGLSVTPGLKEKNAEQGAYVLEIELKHSKLGGFVSFDNRGTTAVGPLQLYTGVNVNSVVGWLERTRLAVFTIPPTTEELMYFEFQQEHILNSHGTTGWFLASRSLVDIGGAPADAENSHGTRILLGFSHPWIRSRDLNFYTSIKFDGFDSDKNSSTQVFDDRIRSLRLGVQLNGNDSFGGSSYVATEISKGFHIFHSTDNTATTLSRTNGRSDYFKATFDASRTQELIENLQMEVYASAQWSPHTLLSAEEFALGGQRYGRAYKPADISGSQGAAGAAELQYSVPFKIQNYVNDVQFYGYYDLGAVWGAGFTRQSMASAGGGIRANLIESIRMQFEATQPLTRSHTPGEASGDDPRFFISLSAQF